MNNGPILIVDADSDDRDFLQDAWKELNYPNKLLFFKTGNEVLNYLESEKETPFLILCDVKLPKMDGFLLKEKMLKDDTINYKSIPFVFWSSEVSKTQLQRAYDLGVNGVFVKENNLEAIKECLVDIVRYWLKCVVPE